MKAFCLLCLFLLPGLLPPVDAALPQTDLGGFVHRITLRRDTTRSRIGQWVSPVQVRLPVGSGFLEVQSAFMYAWKTGPERETAWGALNAHLRGQWALGQRAMVSLHASLPTGKQPLEAAEAELVRALARNDLNFPVKTFGQGLDGGGTFSLVRHVGHWTWSVGAGYLYRGSYEPIEGVADYKPGDEMTASFGLDYTYGRWLYRLSAAGSFYLTDRQAGLVIFRNGKQLTLAGEMRYLGRHFRLKAKLAEVVRLKNQELSNGRFLFETRDSNGNDFRAHLEASLTPTRYITFFVTGGYKHLTANAHPHESPLYQGRAHLVEGGGGLAVSFGRAYHLSLQGVHLTGKAEDGAVDLSASNLRARFSWLF